MAITGKYQVSDIAYGDKDFSEIVESIIQHVNDGHEVEHGNEQLDTTSTILALIEDDSDSVNEGLTYAIRGIQRDDFEQAFDDKLRDLAVDLATSHGEVTHER